MNRMVDDIEQVGYFNGEATWTAFPTIYTPNMLNAGDSIDLLVRVLLFEDILPGYIEDTLEILSPFNTHNVYILVNDSLLVSNDDKAYINKEITCQVYPNPCSEILNISYEIFNMNYIVIDILNIDGTRVTRLVEENQNPGTYKISYNTSESGAGIYLYRIQAGSNAVTGKFVILN